MNNQELKCIFGWQYATTSHCYGELSGCDEEHLELSHGRSVTILHCDNVPWRAFEHKDGVRHGLYVSLYDGELSQVTQYVNGLEHGQSKQYDEGKVIGTYTLDMGTGVDLWFESEGVLAEERHLKNGKVHGVERWWDGHSNQMITREAYYFEGLLHGIERQWSYNDDDVLVLDEGYPKYWVENNEVSYDGYIRLSSHDQTLVKYSARDHDAQRTPPPWGMG